MTHILHAPHVRLFPSLAGYDRSRLTRDAVASLTVWAVLVPEALAYASIAGVSPVIGLYAAPAALLLYAAFGSSRHLIVGPMSATAALSAATVADYASPADAHFLTLTISLAIVVGLIGIGAGLLRLGFVASFISEPVLKGFIVGLALTIIVGQLPALVGIEKTEGDFFEQLWGFVTHLDDANGWTTLVGLASLTLVLTLRRFAPRIPGSLVAVAFGVALIALFGLDPHGVAIVGAIDSGLPSLGLPEGFRIADLGALTPGAVGVLLVGYAESLGAAKNYAAKNNYGIDPNRELLGLGAANLGAGLSSGMVVNGSLSKTAVNGGAGATSQASGLVVAAMTVLTFLFLTGLFEKLPEATLAAIVISALIELVDLLALRRLYDVRSSAAGRVLGVAARADFLAALAALLGVLVFDTLPGLFIGIATSIVLLLYRCYRPRIAVLGRVPGTNQFADVGQHPENEIVLGLVIARPEAGLFFANTDGVAQHIEALAAAPNVRAVLLDAESIPFIDLSAAQMLDHLAARLEGRGQKLLLAKSIAQVRQLLTASGASVHTYTTLHEAVTAFEKGSI